MLTIERQVVGVVCERSHFSIGKMAERTGVREWTRCAATSDGHADRQIARYAALVHDDIGTPTDRRAVLEVHRGRVCGALGELTDALTNLDRKIAPDHGAERRIHVGCADEPVSTVRLIDR